MKTNRRNLIKAAAGAALAMPFVAREGFAQAQVLKLTYADTRNHPLYQVLQRFAETVKTKSNGALEVQVYGTGELGSQANILTGMQTGIIDPLRAHLGLHRHHLPQVPGARPAVPVPRRGDRREGRRRACRQAAPRRDADQGHLRPLLWSLGLARHLDHQSQDAEARGCQGAEGPRQPGPIFAATFRALGANPIAIDYSEVYLALSQHTIEAVETPIIALPSAKHYEVVNTREPDELLLTTPGRCSRASASSMRSRPPMQEVLRASCAELTKDWRKTIVEKTAETTAFLKEKGLTFVDVDREAYRKATESVYKDFRDVIGADLVDAVTKQVG